MLIDETHFCNYLRDSLSGKSVALVGNSPIVLEKNDGAYIDTHDVVIRFNDARVEGLALYVGQKTAIRFLGGTLVERYKQFFKNLQETSTIITTKVNVNSPELADKNDVISISFRIHKTALKIIDSILETNYSNQGLRAARSGLALLAYLIQPEVGIKSISIFGMERLNRAKGAEHFYDDGRLMEKVIPTYDKYHMPLKTELEIFNQILDKVDLVSFN